MNEKVVPDHLITISPPGSVKVRHIEFNLIHIITLTNV